MIAIDTNVLVYAVSEQDPHHGPSRNLIDGVAAGRVSACIFPQNLLEFYAVATNPRRVQRPLSVTEALKEMTALRSILQVVSPRESALDILEGLVATSETTQADVFDAFIAAQMQDAGIHTLCTYNTGDFETFLIELRTPEELLAYLDNSPGGAGFVQDRLRRRPR
ncbi:MAG: type II toxin-antitoxin system VapC family toxin [Bacillota bacterium]